MIRATTVTILALTVTAAVAQPARHDQVAPQAGQPPARIPEIPAGAKPMEREPDPAAGTPAARMAQPPARDRNTNCRVRRADTDTGFVVVCEEDG